MTFDSKKAREICAKYAESKVDETEDTGNSCHYKRLMAAMLPAALDHIEELERALIESRAENIENNPNRSFEWMHENAIAKAREQLHAEGLL